MTLNDLVDEYDGNAFVLADDGNGSAWGKNGCIADYDDIAREEYGDVVMKRLRKPHKSDDGYECLYASDWLVLGEGNNPYRVRLYF